jgi:hypothetical protein
MTPRIMIATPTAGGVAKVPFVVTLADVMRVLMEKGIRCSFVNYDSSDIVMARNFFAARLLLAEEFTHLLFIDSDMSFSGNLILRFLELNQPVVGCVYTKRQIDLEALRTAIQTAVKEGGETRSIEDLSSVMDFVIRLDARQGNKRSLTVTNGFTSVDGVGMGVTLIQRRVFTDMIDREVVRKKRGNYPANIRKSVYGFFDPIWLEHRGEFLSEDLSFCHRWTQDCGGEVLACIDTTVGHVGQFIYTGVFLEKLRQDKKKGR